MLFEYVKKIAYAKNSLSINHFEHNIIIKIRRQSQREKISGHFTYMFWYQIVKPFSCFILILNSEP